MSDARLRELERAAAHDPAAAEALILERIRAGGRDPRHDPRDGDSIDGLPARRDVVRTWPRALAHAVTATPEIRQHVAGGSERLPAGTLVDRVSAVTSELGWSTISVQTAPGVWAYYDVWTRDEEPSLVDAPPGTEVRAVEYQRWGGRGSTRTTIEAWRRWAKRGRVVRVASAPVLDLPQLACTCGYRGPMPIDPDHAFYGRCPGCGEETS